MNIKDQVISIIVDFMEDDNVKNVLEQNDDLTLLGINSISFIRLIVELEKSFHVEFADDSLDFSKYNSLTALCEYLGARIKQNT